MVIISLEVKKLEESPYIDEGMPVKVTESGNITKVQFMTKRNTKATIKVLPGMKEYIELSTGEIKEMQHHTTRATQYKSLQRTFENIKDTINANITDVQKVKWITLTYQENMMDTKRLYKDFKNFNERFVYFCKKNNYGNTEYIVIMEPQGRGAWHCHLLYIFVDLVKAPYIDNNTEFQPIWNNGFTKIKNLENIDNLGVYLVAYLGDMEIHECRENGIDVGGWECKLVDFEEDGKTKSKCYIKGARLPLYPAKFNMMRCSRGIQKANSYMTTQKIAMKKVSADTLTYEKTLMLSDNDTNFNSLINTKYYNKIRKKTQ